LALFAHGYELVVGGEIGENPFDGDEVPDASAPKGLWSPDFGPFHPWRAGDNTNFQMLAD